MSGRKQHVPPHPDLQEREGEMAQRHSGDLAVAQGLIKTCMSLLKVCGTASVIAASVPPTVTHGDGGGGCPPASSGPRAHRSLMPGYSCKHQATPLQPSRKGRVRPHPCAALPAGSWPSAPATPREEGWPKPRFAQRGDPRPAGVTAAGWHMRDGATQVSDGKSPSSTHACQIFARSMQH